jgi:hypothetical protein
MEVLVFQRPSKRTKIGSVAFIEPVNSTRREELDTVSEGGCGGVVLWEEFFDLHSALVSPSF